MQKIERKIFEKKLPNKRRQKDQGKNCRKDGITKKIVERKKMPKNGSSSGLKQIFLPSE